LQQKCEETLADMFRVGASEEDAECQLRVLGVIELTDRLEQLFGVFE
jgi:hypothetical protein